MCVCTNCTAITSTRGEKGDTGATGERGAVGPAYTLPYKLYVATLYQTGTTAPVATILENTLSGTPVWSYTDVGDYKMTLAGEFPDATKIIKFITPPAQGNLELYRTTADDIILDVYNGVGAPVNGQLDNVSFELRVYP